SWIGVGAANAHQICTVIGAAAGNLDLDAAAGPDRPAVGISNQTRDAHERARSTAASARVKRANSSSISGSVMIKGGAKLMVSRTTRSNKPSAIIASCI